MIKDDKTFGQRLREARVSANLSQSELAVISGIPKARLSRYENGHVAPSIQTLERLASALGVSEASLLGDQRSILEGFFSVLDERGVRIATPEQGARLANALADMLQALGASDPHAGGEMDSSVMAVAQAMVASGDWLQITEDEAGIAAPGM